MAVYRRFSPLFEDDLYAAITPEASIAARAVPGGTAPDEVRRQIAASRAAVRDDRVEAERLQAIAKSVPIPTRLP
jgi:argininosuccinate lyase